MPDRRSPLALRLALRFALRVALLATGLAALGAGAAAPKETPMNAAVTESVPHVPWSRQATIYEVNLRQYTPEGTIAAFIPNLPHLRAMGIDIVWLMPVHPIGVKNRKGTLGSYYAVRDYEAVNTEFGTQADLKRLVDEAHALGMKVILDWVANHTAWDHPWVSAHPDWYKKNARGEIYPVTFGEGANEEQWTDVVALDYRQPALRQAMIEALGFWVREVGIDGYRCDVAGLVPTPFWEEARAALDRIKPVFMLAEWSEPELHRAAFDMTYDWALHDVMKAIAKGKATVADLTKHLSALTPIFPADAYRMTFTANHDSNSWQGSDIELFGPSLKAFAVLAATLPGMPLIYGGQESGLDKRLAFFEKDTIAWKDRPLNDFYAGLMQLKHLHPALANGSEGGALELIHTGNASVFAFRRAKAADVVTVVVNLSSAAQTLKNHATLGTRVLAPWSWQIDARK
jgi:glycosidase